MYYPYIEKTDPEVAAALNKEIWRQQQTIELIASENIVSPAVMEAMGSIATNKYAEGYPGKRYYGGCENVDTIEQLAIDRAKELFNAEHANVQPHSGAQANAAAYFALMRPGDTLMGMSLDAGGHLTHGYHITASGIFYNAVNYGVGADGRIDYDEVRKLALEHRPKVIVAGASAYPRIIDWKAFRSIADEVGAYLMVDMAHIAGLVATGIHPSPVPYADVVTTTTHKTLRGPRGGMILCKKELAKQIDKAVFPCTQGGPLEHIIAAKAVMLKEAMAPEFVDYQKQVVANCAAMAATFSKNGIKMVTGGTDNHLLLLDLRGTAYNGKQLETALEKVGITLNKNAIPNDPLPPSKTSGVRIGTAVVTTRGMKEKDCEAIADAISKIILQTENAEKDAKYTVDQLTYYYPIKQFEEIPQYCKIHSVDLQNLT